MNLRELDQIIASGQFPALDGLGVGWDPRLWPAASLHAAGLAAC